MKNPIAPFLALEKKDRSCVIFLFLAFFAILFGYSSIRSVVTALYLEHYGAKSTPLVSFFAVFALMAVLWICSELQRRLSIQKLFTLLSVVSVFLFLTCYLGLQHSFKPLAHVLFIWKELYVVLLVHLLWGYAVNYFTETSAKFYFGFIAAGGSVGGILGGIFVSKLNALGGIPGVVYSMSGLMIFTAVLFSRCPDLTPRIQNVDEVQERNKASPISALKGIERYVLFFTTLVVLSQFCMVILDFKFNLQLEKAFSDVTKRAQTLGLLYAYINGVSLFIKIAALPLLFMILNNIQVQRLVPVTYLGMVLLGLGHPSFFVAAFSFAFMKCSDYSIFSVSKELFYYGLTAEQKFGMKYVGDMFGYRLGKALISAFLIFVQDEKTLGFVLVGLLLVWCGLFFVTPKLKTSASGTTL